MPAGLPLFVNIVFGAQPFQIAVVDAENGWRVPLVELRTTHNVRFVTDNNGLIAFDLPELMNHQTWFSIEGHGYSVKPDGFGYRGVRLTPTPGGKSTVKVNRQLPAKRLGRITGAGIFAESQKLGLELEWREQGILGCDSVQTVVHNQKLYWAWGDTNLARYRLGLFHMIGATTAIQPLSSFKPPMRLRFDYFTDKKDAPRVIAKMPGRGPTWLSGFASLPDQSGNHRLVAHYVKVTPPLTVYESGLCVWNESTQSFERGQVLWRRSAPKEKMPPVPTGHPVFWNDEAGKRWLLFGDPFPRLKIAASFESWSDPKSWIELEPQPNVAADGEATPIVPHRGSIAWNTYRKRWVAIFTQLFGKPSGLGEIWYAEADSPFGEWKRAVKVVTHANYSFYNPRIHPEFTPDDSPILLFEGTYTRLFANNPPATPRHEYNQILYRLDLDDSKLTQAIKEK